MELTVRSSLGPTEGLTEQLDLGEAIRIKHQVVDQLVIQEGLGAGDGLNS